MRGRSGCRRKPGTWRACGTRWSGRRRASRARARSSGLTPRCSPPRPPAPPGCPDRAAWDAAAAAWESLGQPYPLACALLRAAAAAAAAGDRDAAASRLQRAADLAGQLRARPLLAQISQLARRAHVEIAGTGPDGPAAPFGLTGRELEVLRLVAAGLGNREIAAELFISPKTASVHVSNILGKLGVASRGEAAATAHRLHLFDTP